MSTPLIVVRPVTVTDSILVSTNVPETDYAAWSSATTYDITDRRIKAHKVWESLQAGNLNHDPETSPTWWIEVGPTNAWKLFDTSNSTATAQAGSMTYVLAPGVGVNALAALNVRGCNDVQVVVDHPTLGQLYDKTTSLTSLPGSSGWWEWFYGTRTAPPLMVATDLPGVPGCTVTVTFTGTSELSVGVLMVGEQTQVGIAVQQGARVGITDYSRKETNDFGDTVLVQRAYAKRATFDVPIESHLVDDAVEFLSGLRASPCLWIGSGLYASTVIFGFYKDFEVNLAYRTVSECSLTIEGMT